MGTKACVQTLLLKREHVILQQGSQLQNKPLEIITGRRAMTVIRLKPLTERYHEHDQKASRGPTWLETW